MDMPEEARKGHRFPGDRVTEGSKLGTEHGSYKRTMRALHY